MSTLPQKAPGSLSQAYQLLALVALSGELPASQLSRLAGGTSYKENVVKSLKRQRLLLSYYKNGLRGYRLTAAAKKLLLEHNPERFSFYLSGACATNHIRSEPEQRLRLHRVSQTLITMRNANVSIFRDEKPGVFRPGETAIGSICTPAFYSSREIKEMGTAFVKIRGARSVGVLLTPQHIHVVYNLGSTLMKWSYKAEMRTKALMQTVLCRERMPYQYHPDAVQGLLLGDSMELAYELLTDQGGKNYFVLDGSYERFCFLTNDHHGEVLLRLLCDIQKCVLNRSGYLYDEPHFLLQQEVSEVGSYFSIIKAIAAGNHKLSTIAAVLEVKSTNLTKYLKTLMDLDILERRVPVTEENPEKSKRGLYKIKDNYLRFWFAFIYPNMSFIESGHSGIVMDKIRRGLTTSHIGFVYEDICQERMWELNVNNAWPFQFSKLGGYWDAKNEIDIAALDPEGKNLILGECKYWKEPVDLNVLHELEAKAGDVAWERDRRKVWYVLFSISGFSDELRNHAATRDDLLLIDDGER